MVVFGQGRNWWVTTVYCILYEGICLRSLAKKVEQTNGRTDAFEILAELKLGKKIKSAGWKGVLLKKKNREELQE